MVSIRLCSITTYSDRTPHGTVIRSFMGKLKGVTIQSLEDAVRGYGEGEETAA